MSSIANAVDEALDRSQQPGGITADIPGFLAGMLNREARTIGNAWYIKGLADVLSGIKEGTLGGTASSLTQVADRLLPAESLLNEIRKVEDMTVREPTNVLEREANRLPFASRSVQPRLSATTGRPEESPEDWFSTIVRGTPSGMMTPNPVAAEVSRLNEGGNRVSVPYVEKSFAGAKQTPEQERLIHQQMGTAVSLYVGQVMNDPKYAKLTDAQKADALQSAITQAREASNISLSNQVERSPHESALLLWAQTPQYYGVHGTPDEIARQNWEIEQAKSKLSAYNTQYGQQGENRLRREDPNAYKLATQRRKLTTAELDRKKKAIDKATGGALSDKAETAAAGGLVGVGSTTAPRP
jgi:hypothetical protein